MILSHKYFKRALSLRYGKLILVIQAILIVSAMYVFMKTIPWLTAQNISEISSYEDPSPPPPSEAESFAVNHGHFIYYEDSRATNPGRLWLYIGLNFIFMLPSMISTAIVWWWPNKKNVAEQGEASDR
ncbi:MAG: hypothetical protein H7A51_13460 [Akkermansiaceae bacterium]|nr:hypothetical protein [Akkermansiaceae bacterium]